MTSLCRRVGVAWIVFAAGLVVCPSPAFADEADASMLRKAVAVEARRLALLPPSTQGVRVMQAPSVQARSVWNRHPVLIGSIIGFVGGFSVGLALGDGRVADWSSEFAGLVFGGIGAAAGATVGRLTE